MTVFREFKQENGKNMFTFQNISESFNLKHRQDSNNYYRDYKESGEDMLMYLQRKVKLSEAFPIIERIVLEIPFLTTREYYETLCTDYPEHKMSFATFQKYFSQIDSLKLKKRYDELVTSKKYQIDKGRILKEVLEEDNISRKKRKNIMSVFPELEQDEKEMKNEISFKKNWEAFTLNLLIMYLVASNMSFKAISILFGVSKSTIHNWFYRLSFLKVQIIESIKWWSGIISVDEKWIRINGKWKYLLSIVDNTTGFLLFYMIASDLKAETWKIFFQRFYRIFGTPKLIISDGSGSLASGRQSVFPNVPHQLCKFHKLKNLMRNIYLSYENREKHERMVKLAINIFANTTYFGRKRAAKKLMKIAPPKVAKYLKNNILGNWKYLRKSLTSNAVERFNKKIEKVISKRYGLKSIEFVDQLIASLWLREAILDKRHFDKSFVKQIDLPKESKEYIKMCNFTKAVPANLLKNIA